jgi:hypothetical protein
MRKIKMLHPPSWQKDALPTGRGWAHPKTGELLKATRLSTADINDYLGIPKTPIQAATPPPELDISEIDRLAEKREARLRGPEPSMENAQAAAQLNLGMQNLKDDKDEQMEMLLEADPIDLNKMTKLELETYGRTKGIELDRRKSKADLINTLNEG